MVYIYLSGYFYVAPAFLQKKYNTLSETMHYMLL